MTSIASDVDYLKLNADTINRAEAYDRSLIDGLLKILRIADEPFLKRLSRSLIEGPPLPAKDEVLQNAFFALNPDQYRPFAAVTLVALREHYADVFDEYELGLLSAILPDVPRLNYINEKDRLGVVVRRIERILTSDEYRLDLYQVFTMLTADQTFLAECAESQVAQSLTKNLFSPDSVRGTLGRLRKGQVNVGKGDQLKLLRMGQVIKARTLRWILENTTDEDAVLAARARDNKIHAREAVARFQARYLSEALGLTENAMRMSLALRALDYEEPLPVESSQLKRQILARSEALLRPILSRDRPPVSVQELAAVPEPEAPSEPEAVSNLEPAAKIQVVPEREPEPGTKTAAIFHVKDHFAPPPQSKKRSRGTSAPAANAEPPPKIESFRIDPALDLNQFTSFVSVARDLNELRSDLVYRFVYQREHHPKLRSLRFSDEALDWFVRNPATGRQIISAINLGELGRNASGIKPTAGRSRRFDGPVYEVVVHGKNRALLLLVDNTWQVLRVVHIDDLLRAVRWLSPLPDSP